jgi:hypothetical protein
MSKILGIDKSVFFSLMFLVLLVILGVVTFHSYSYASTNTANGFSIGGGVGLDVNLMKQRQMQQMAAAN